MTALGAAAANPDLALFVVVGVLAGAHCLGMCGPLVATYADRMGERDRLTPHDVSQHALFNVGRTAGYALAGSLLGAVGGAVVGAAATATTLGVVRGVVGVGVGLLVVAAGVSSLLGGRLPTGGGGLPVVGHAFRRVTGLLVGNVDRAANSPGVVGLGAVHALLPCPILYPAYLYAFAVGDPVRGGVALGLLGVGTVPTVLATGLVAGGVSLGHRPALHRALGAVLVCLGYLPLSHGLGQFGVDLPAPGVPFYQPLALATPVG